MISAFSYYCLGRLMQEFLPHILVNDCATLRMFWSSLEPPVQRPTVVKVLKPGESVDLSDPDAYSRVIPDKMREALKSQAVTLRDECVKLHFKASFASIARMIQTLDNPNGLLKSVIDDAKEIEGRIVDELKYTTCFALEGKTEELYRVAQPFGSDVADRFPSATLDAEEAAKCIALDRGTAGVFHLM